MKTTLDNSTNLEFDTRNSTFELSSPDGYLQLSPIGLFPHARGLQNVDKTSLETLVKNFKSFFARLGRRFAGLPFYVGHPDVHGYENSYTDRKAYGWIMDLQVRDDGLYGRTKWSAAGRDLLAQGHYKFLSPTWTAEKIGTENGRGVYRPTHLISVGLTNQPNLPVPPLANCEGDEEETLVGRALPLEARANDQCPNSNDQLMTKTPMFHAVGQIDQQTDRKSSADCQSAVSQVANLPAPGCEESAMSHPGLSNQIISSPSAVAAVEGNPPSDTPPTPRPTHNRNHNPTPPSESAPPASPAVERPEKTSDFDIRPSHLDDFEQRLENYQTQLTDLHESLLTTILDNAIANTRILPIERKHWHTELADNFEAASATLANTKPKLNIAPQTNDLSRTSLTPQNYEQKQKRILSLVNEKMTSAGLSYHQAWLETKSNHPELF